ncbi:DNA-binding GntR family transcriptional regulator [Aliiruegeria haliotis]|uniref:DNA-binding GntR family transcriptional regulator n=1 Tax=Aliiruegeria haliotis TaxID=1280846 RepID=A0A2T0RIE5_9RHOB|nr:GntR family transcriptional regulator [Aliiruegeria haliotis]PRY20928.1 DNA-binding GntR family transcriptional regulator [Aliiruegeria haliotis]
MSDAPRPKSNTAKAQDTLREMIFAGDLMPGSTYLEAELAEILGMSRTPVREAALRLESQGLLEVRPRHGVRITPISPEDMEEIYEILTEIEGMCAEKAADAGHSAEEVRALEEAMAQMDAALEAEDREAWAAADEAFHRALILLGHNKRAEMIFDMYSDQVRRARAVTLWLRPAPSDSNAAHRAVCDAILRCDAEAAGQLHRDHRRQARVLITDLLRRHGLRHI